VDSTGIDATERTLVARHGPAAIPLLRLENYLSYEKDGTQQRLRIGPAGVTVGRHPGCDIVFAVPEVSRQHCRVMLDADAVAVHDLGSTNGTFVAGLRIDRPTHISNGAHITIGGFVLRYEQRDEREVEDESRLTAELRQAVEYVRSILPDPVITGSIQAEWVYVPSSELGGDAFGYRFLDDSTLAGFLIDVSGHGIGAGMHAVAVANVLRRGALPNVDFRDPGQVAAGLNLMFPMEDHGGLMFTLSYFVYDTASRTLRFCTAGHHEAFLVAPGAPEAEAVWLRAPVIGMVPRRAWPSGTATIAPGSRLYIFSDGAFEIEQPDGVQWQISDLRRIISQGLIDGLNEPRRLYQAVRAAARPGPLADDFSMLVLSFV
jgi:serine phosphatase RsbU (regulator of sigma subunit)